MVALENSLDTSELKKTIKTRLQEDKVQDELSELFVYYLQQTSRLCTLATVESNGVRPRGLENEIYSCFHHVARGLACVSFGEEVIAQIRAGYLTHLKRAHLDACKITINSYLSQYTKTIATLNNLVVIEDFKSFTLSGVEKIKQILDCSTQIKQNYLNGYPYSLVVLNRSTILQITPHYSELLLYFSSL